MKLAFLSYGVGWHVRDLGRAAAELGHTSDTVDFRTVHARLARPASSLSGYDAVIVRSMPPGSLEQIIFRMDVLQQLKTSGVRVVNPPRALEICIDKYLASARLEAAGLPVPATAVCQDSEAAMAAFHELGGDVVVKPLFGSEGRGMLRVSQADLAWRVFRTLERTAAVLYVQEFIAHPGWDLRVFVLAGRVLAAMRRFASDGWRTNVAQGGRAEAARIAAAEESLALQAAAAVGTHVCGVDLLPLPTGGYVVLEVNAVPGWRALGRTTNLDIAGEILRSLEASGP
jgi:ribosomal protein S6--L-glutamate ligase